MATYMRESDDTEMLEVAPFQFVSAAYLTGNPVIEDESASEHIEHPNNRERHRIADLIRIDNALHGVNRNTEPTWNW